MSWWFIVNVTSTELTYFIEFSYMMYEKEDNVIYALEICHDLCFITPESIIP